MSEYQYYEFVSVDRPLTRGEQAELRAISTRAQITASSFVNTYEWGDLKADPRELMEKYFDAFLYLANWGTHQISLRLPIGQLDPAVAAAYCVGPSAECWTSDTHVIMNLQSEDEDGDDEWEDGHGRLAPIVPVRAELATGDTRLLYLAWLLCVQGEELDEDEREPTLPAGLAQLSGPLRSLADFLRIDRALLAAAAAASRPLAARKPSKSALSRWAKGLPEADKDDVIVRLMRGEGAHLRSELMRWFHGPAPEADAGSGRTVGELLAAAGLAP